MGVCPVGGLLGPQQWGPQWPPVAPVAPSGPRGPLNVIGASARWRAPEREGERVFESRLDEEGLEEAEEEEEEMRMGVVDRTGSTGGSWASWCCLVTDSFSEDVFHWDTPLPTVVPAEVFHPGGDRDELEDGLGSIRKAGGHPAMGYPAAGPPTVAYHAVAVPAVVRPVVVFP